MIADIYVPQTKFGNILTKIGLVRDFTQMQAAQIEENSNLSFRFFQEIQAGLTSPKIVWNHGDPKYIIEKHYICH
jgi:hypothetical protein